VSKWLCGNSIFGQLFNEDVQATNKVNPNNFSLLVMASSLGKVDSNMRPCILVET